MRRDVIVLGSTGSIGTQALDVIADNPELFRVEGVSAGGRDPEGLARQVARTGARVVAVADESAVDPLAGALQEVGAEAEILVGVDGVADLASRPCDVVVNAITGAAGLSATLAALNAGARLALANKESLVIGGALVARIAADGQITPIDSEHSAIAQCLRAGRRGEVARIVLTASGGPFRGWTTAELATVTPDQALEHPTWAMGPLVTINSATLVNKGLELIEAHLLFDVPLACIDVVVHPQSVVHSMVTFMDGSTIAQASPPDMRLPIALALGWPDRVASKASSCVWSKATAWTFEPLDESVFPAVALARRVGAVGGTAPAVMNGANEACVEAFRAGRIRLPDIVGISDAVVSAHLAGLEAGPDSVPDGATWVSDESLTAEAINAADRWARAEATKHATAAGGRQRRAEQEGLEN